MTHDLQNARTGPGGIPVLPKSTLGWWCTALAAVPLVLFGLLMFVLPVVALLLGIDEIDIAFLDTWITPVAMAVLLLAAGVVGIVAHRRGERALIPELIIWLSLASGSVLAVFLIGAALSGE